LTTLAAAETTTLATFAAALATTPGWWNYFHWC
jgi:hypothetical protein